MTTPPRKRKRGDAMPGDVLATGGSNGATHANRLRPRRRRSAIAEAVLPRDAAATTPEADAGARLRHFEQRVDALMATDEVDEFGYDPAYERKLMPLFDLMYEKYFRVELHGVDRVPSEGRCLLVANHSGTLPLDGLMLRMAVRREHPRRRDVRWLAEDGIFHFPFLGNITNRVGAVRACQENAERLLEHESLVAVFPEGKKGIGKLFRDRYRLQRFGRGGFVKLCLRTHTPIVPVAIVGGEETNPLLARFEYLTKALGIPYLPVTPTFPLLGPAGLLPAPTKWKIFFGEPIVLESYPPASTDDEILVGRLTERVRGAIQAMLDSAISQRRSVWFG
jgi:1-acyl-sn-glycerol-3-phosphate acyltransferase